MKKLLMILTIALLVFGLIACSSSEGAVNEGADNSAADETVETVELADFDDYSRPVVKSNEEMSVIYLISNMTDESNIRCEQQAAIEAAHRGWDYQVINYESQDNFREYFQNAINQNPTAIIIGITQAFDSFQDLVATAREAGIGVYSNDNSLVDGVISNSTLDNTQAAVELMDKIASDYPEPLNATVYELAMSEVVTHRAEAAKEYIENNENMTLLDSIDLASTGDLYTAGFTIAQTWLNQYDELDLIFCSADPPAMSAAEAVTQANADTVLCGVDGGSASWNYIRSGTPLKYTYSQPFEYFTHQTFEVISDIQVEGLNPGDEGCLISESGATLTSAGIVTTIDNVPAVGSTISSVFDYYGGSEDDDAWYNWTDGPGLYIVTDTE